MSITQSTFDDVSDDGSASNQSTDDIIDATIDGLGVDADVRNEGEELVIERTDDREIPDPTSGDIIEVGVRDEVLCSPTRDDGTDNIIVAGDEAVVF